MVLKFFETLDSVAKYIEEEEKANGVYFTRRSVGKSFGSKSELVRGIVKQTSSLLHKYPAG